jgi:hypothetical protein
MALLGLPYLLHASRIKSRGDRHAITHHINCRDTCDLIPAGQRRLRGSDQASRDEHQRTLRGIIALMKKWAADGK